MSPVGLAGSIKAVTVDASPLPVGFTARSANVYVTPLSSPVMVYEVVDALLPPSKSEKFAPPSVLYWYFVIVALARDRPRKGRPRHRPAWLRGSRGSW